MCGLGEGLEGWCHVMYVCVVSLDYLRIWLVHVSVYSARLIPAHLGVHPVFTPVAHYRYLLHTVYLSVADIANQDLLAFVCRTWIRLDIVRFYEEQ